MRFCEREKKRIRPGDIAGGRKAKEWSVQIQMDFSGTGRARAGGSGRDPLELELCLWGRRQADSTVRGIGMGMGGRCCVLLRMASAPRHLATCLLSPSFLVSSWTYYCTSRSAAVAAERAELAGRRIGAVGRLPGRSARRGASASTLAWPLAATAPGSSRFAQSQVTCATLNKEKKSSNMREIWAVFNPSPIRCSVRQMPAISR